MNKPVIAITMGDANGIGPELTAKILSDVAVYDRCRPFVVGDARVMRQAAEITGAGMQFEVRSSFAEVRFSPPVVDVLCPPRMELGPVRWGVLDPAMGRASAQCLGAAYDLATAGNVQGVVSAPLNKEAFHLAGYDYADELAFLADYTDSVDTFILGVMRSVWTVSVAEHVAFRNILDLIKTDRILLYIRRMDRALRMVGLPNPQIAVAALNVHAGDGGIFGSEEADEIEPAIAEAQNEGINAQGPVPADMVFALALEGRFDGVVGMHHDQANIARKLQPKEESTTLFMGLPVVCGTTAHGTAFDIAGRGIADPGSLRAALGYVSKLAAQAD
jgi:4-hydroxy-L-threonine phosphate dehydrogenase PdxA